MPRQQIRYIVRNPSGQYYTGNVVMETVPVARKSDPSQNDMVQRFEPVFDSANAELALKYDTEADAAAAMKHADCVSPEAFDGCEVEPY